MEPATREKMDMCVHATPDPATTATRGPAVLVSRITIVLYRTFLIEYGFWINLTTDSLFSP